MLFSFSSDIKTTFTRSSGYLLLFAPKGNHQKHKLIEGIEIFVYLFIFFLCLPACLSFFLSRSSLIVSTKGTNKKRSKKKELMALKPIHVELSSPTPATTAC
jgi:hypothetical protein